MGTEETSQAAGTANVEQGGQSVQTGTNLPADNPQPAASQGQTTTAQEQPSTTSAQGISEAERERRREQSLIDKATARAQAEFARLQRQTQEQQRLAGMDDSELGAEVRRQQELQAYANNVRQQDLAAIREQTLSIVKDEAAREAVEEQERAGKFHSYAEFLDACHKAQLEVEKARLRTHIEKEVREAVTKESVAEEAERGGPQLGSGNAPSGKLTLDAIKKMTPEEINKNWDQVQEALKRS